MTVPSAGPTSNGSIHVHQFRVSSEAFGWVSVKKAAYKFSERCAFDFQSEGKEIVCKLLFTEAHSPEVLASIELAFRNELLDQDLRAHIATETTPLRNAILAFAFSKTGVQGTDEI